MIKDRINAWLNNGNGVEDRAGYTDILTQAILSRANATDSVYSGALEIAAGTVSRAFASATPAGRDARYFTPVVMAEIGRDLIECGESVWRIGQERLIHLPALDIQPGVRQLHLRYSTDVHSGRGIGPLGRAAALVTLANTVENSLAKEAGALVGYILPIPTDGQDASVAQLRQDLRALDGKIALVETAAGGWDAGRAAAPRREYEPRRLGPDIPESSLRLYRDVNRMVLVACGLPTEMLDEHTDGTSNRETWRRFLHGTLQPLARIIQSQAAEADLAVEFSFEALMASDIAGRARAFGSLVQSGMDVEDAAILTGLIDGS